MDTAILVLISTVLGGGVLGALAIVLGWEIRTLRLKTRVDALEVSTELVRGQLLAEIKRRAGAAGLDQMSRNKEIKELARNLPTEKIVPEFPPAWWESDQKVRNG